MLLASPPHREVITEKMIGMEGAGTRNGMTLTPVRDATLLTVVVTYPTRELRDEVLATGMVDGMERSYERLEPSLVPA